MIIVTPLVGICSKAYISQWQANVIIFFKIFFKIDKNKRPMVTRDVKTEEGGGKSPKKHQMESASNFP